MKKILTVFLTILLSNNLFAQIELTGFGGWLWTGSIPAWRQNIKVSDMGNYGITVGTTVRDQTVAEFEWNHTENTATFREYELDGSLGQVRNVGLTLNYYMIGIQHEVGFDDQVKPYGLVNIGMLNARSEAFGNNSSQTNNWFAAGFGGGIKYFLSDHIGIRLQARLLVPMQFGGVGFGCGIGTGGGGCGAGVSTYSNIIQGDFTGGVVLKLGE